MFWLLADIVNTSLAAAQTLEKEGLNIKVVNTRFVKPLDKNWLLETLGDTKTVITVEENVLAGGFGSAIQEYLEGYSYEIHRIGIPDKFIEHGTQPQLRKLVGLDEEGLKAKFQTAVRIARKPSFFLVCQSWSNLALTSIS